MSIETSSLSPDKRTVLLDAAARLFKEKGYGSASMRDLAARLGIKAASLYNYIASKDELLEELCFRIAQTYMANMEELLNSELSFDQRFRKAIRVHIRLMVEDTAAVSVANNEWRSLQEPKLSEFKTLRRRYEQSLAQLLEQGMEAGVFRRMHVSVALFTVLSALRWVELWYNPKRNITEREIEEEITNILLNGIINK